MSNRPMLFKLGFKPNLFIDGAVLSGIDSKATLASKLSITENDIIKFKTKGNNIIALIETNYNINSSAFQSDQNITRVEETDGYLKRLGFRGFYLSKVKTVIAPGVTVADGQTFYKANVLKTLTTNISGAIGSYYCDETYQLETAVFNNVTSTGLWAFRNARKVVEFIGMNPTSVDRSFQSCFELTTFNFSNLVSTTYNDFENTKLTSVNMPVCTSALNATFKGSTITDLTAPLVTTLGTGALQDCLSFTTLNAPSLTTIGSSALRNTPLFTNLTHPTVTTLGSFALYDGGFTTVSLPECTAISQESLKNNGALTTIYLPKCIDFGGSTGNNLNFVGVPSTCTVTVDQCLKYAINGSPDLDIQAAIDQGMTVIYYNPYASGVNYVDTQAISFSSFTFNNTGLKLYSVSGNASLVEYGMNNPYTISGIATTGNTGFGLNTARAIQFSSDGSNMYIMEDSGDASIVQYSLSVAFDPTTGSVNNIGAKIVNLETYITNFYISPDGVKLYVLGYSTSNVTQYTMSTPWDITTALGDGVSYNFGLSNVYSFTISVDGKNALVYNGSKSTISQYTMTTPWDISTVDIGSFMDLDVSAQITGVRNYEFADCGKKLIVSNVSSIVEYTLNPAYSI